MHIEGFLHKILSPVMHKKRLSTLSILVMTVLRSKKLSLTELGREMKLPIKERSCIRRSDRFLGNKKLHQEREAIHGIIIQAVIGNRICFDIIVDWSNIPNTTHNTLRASLVADGRSITLYEEVHPEKNLGNKATQNAFLCQLKELLPKKCKPVIITDAGFHNDWFKEVLNLGWDYLGRIRGKKYFKKTKDEWKKCSELFLEATEVPRHVGKVELCRSNAIETHLILFKSKHKGRASLTRLGKKRQDGDSVAYRKSAKEPWLLATSLKESYFLPEKVVKKYSARMQIEEGFRDLKSTKYGFGFENSYSKTIARIEVLLLIAMLASFIAWIIGWAAEKMELHYQFQSNTVKNRRVLSLFFLGCQILKRGIKIPINVLTTAVNRGLCYEA